MSASRTAGPTQSRGNRLIRLENPSQRPLIALPDFWNGKNLPDFGNVQKTPFHVEQLNGYSGIVETWKLTLDLEAMRALPGRVNFDLDFPAEMLRKPPIPTVLIVSNSGTFGYRCPYSVLLQISVRLRLPRQREQTRSSPRVSRKRPYFRDSPAGISLP